MRRKGGGASFFFCKVFSLFTKADCSPSADSVTAEITQAPSLPSPSGEGSKPSSVVTNVADSDSPAREVSSGVGPYPSLSRSDVQSMIDSSIERLPAPTTVSPSESSVQTVVYRSSSAQGDSIVSASARMVSDLRADIQEGRVSVPLSAVSGQSSVLSGDAELVNATSTTFFSTVGRFATGVVDTLSSAVATIASLFVENLTATNATSTNSVVTGGLSAGSLSLGTALAVTSGGTGASDASSARLNLGLAYATSSDISATLFNNIATWGDSLTAGAGGTPYPTQLASLTGATVYNGGVGGETSTQIKARMLAATDKHAHPTIIWAGRNNYSSPETVKADIAEMVAALGHNNYLIIGVINGNYPSEYSGGAGHTLITNLNSDLSETYGSRFIDVRQYLVSLYDSGIPQDVTDHDNDIVPSSLRSDSIHLTTAGYLAVAQRIYQDISVLRSGATGSVVNPQTLQYAFSNPFPIGATTRAGGYFSQVGVGTSTPARALSVVGGDVEIDQSRFYYAKDASGNSVRVAGVSGSNLFLGGSYVSNLYLGTGFTGQSQALTIANGGSVGVGTTTPSARLSVTGAAGSGDIFAVASSTNARLLTVTSAGALGVGTSSPSALLSVSGSSAFAGLATFSSNVFMTGGSLYLQSSGAGLYLPGNGGIAGNNGAINLTAAGTNQNITLTPSGTGAVGIGTTTPSARLAVTGTAGTSDIFALASSTNARVLTVNSAGNSFFGGNISATGTIASNMGSGNGQALTVITDGSTRYANLAFNEVASNKALISWIGSGAGLGARNNTLELAAENSGGDIAFRTGGATKMFLTDGGLLGIGTTTPSTALDVVGVVNASGGYTYNTSSSGSGLTVNTTANTTYNNISFTENSSLRSLISWIGSNAGLGTRNNTLELSAEASGGDIALRAGNATRLFVDAGGNVGVGTLTPGAKLDVGGSVKATSYARGVATTTSQLVFDGDSMTFGYGLTTPYPNLVTTTHTFSRYNTAVSGRTVLDMILNATTSVDARLSDRARENIVVVWGGINSMALEGITPVATYNELVAYARERRAAGFKVIIGTMVSRTGSNGNGTFDSQKNTYNALIRANWANFADGIADLAGDARLGADGAYSNLTYFQADGIHINDTGAAIVAGIVSTAIDRLTEGNVKDLNDLYVTGKMGIGTTSPSEKLSVAGNIIVTNGSRIYGFDSSGNKAVIAQIAAGLNDLYLGGSYVGNLYLGTGAGTQRVTVTNGGNVGIGTTTPSAQLTTSGTVRFASLGSAGANLITDSLGNVTVSSDERLKDVQGEFARGLSDISKIKPITYKWNAVSGMETSGLYTGFSAQNVQSSIPEAVATDSRGYLTLSDRPILAAVVNALKELSAKVDGIMSSNFTYVNEASIGVLNVGKLNIQGDICVDNVCVTKEQFKSIFTQNGSTVYMPQPVQDTSSEAEGLVPTETASSTSDAPDTSSASSTPEEAPSSADVEVASSTPPAEEVVSEDPEPQVSETPDAPVE